MPTLVHTNENVEATYFLTRVNKNGDKVEKLCWCHEKYPEDMRTGSNVYASEHEVTDDEAQRLAIAIRGKNLTVKAVKKKKKES